MNICVNVCDDLLFEISRDILTLVVNNYVLDNSTEEECFVQQLSLQLTSIINIISFIIIVIPNIIYNIMLSRRIISVKTVVQLFIFYCKASSKLSKEEEEESN
ncbi:hypothetical protein T4D_2836 [Trichinella pseudospiralis]|uniref:Uncharacterized protein n=1 Tax=Trichinella pseudospiralis TaxID=6337 RepID=A0A0V1FIP6_TRIPS|nr:hypothetical protein T4D_2836 [Trichinella pseudospiralis]